MFSLLCIYHSIEGQLFYCIICPDDAAHKVNYTSTMVIRKSKTAIAIVLIATCVLVVALALLLAPKPASQQVSTHSTPSPSASRDPSPAPQAVEAYSGQEIAISSNFKVKVPNGWRASVSTQANFLAVQFARPGEIKSLVYNKSVPPTIDYNGIPSWGGLTEHYYMRSITAESQAFDPASHAEITSEQFTFADSTVGTKYFVTKRATEAQKWGGLLKDSEWYGRVYVYEKTGKRIEAHIAYYPSTQIDTAFFENVAASIKL